MPEIPDVVQGTPVASDWGNDIRDRTLQRYADASERDALNPLPAPGDLAYLDATGEVQCFTTSWLPIARVSYQSLLVYGDFQGYCTETGADTPFEVYVDDGVFTLYLICGGWNSDAFTGGEQPDGDPVRNGSGIVRISWKKNEKEPERNLPAGKFLIEKADGTQERIFLFRLAALRHFLQCFADDGFGRDAELLHDPPAHLEYRKFIRPQVQRPVQADHGVLHLS